MSFTLGVGRGQGGQETDGREAAWLKEGNVTVTVLATVDVFSILTVSVLISCLLSCSRIL